MKTILKLLLGMVVLGGIGAGVYFGYFREKATESSNVVPVKIMLKWLHQSQFSGVYVAYDKGWYQDEGLNPEIIPFDPQAYYIDMVATGSAEFGVAGADEILLARSQGKPVVALAVIYQENPVIAYTLASSGITNVAQMKGKRLGLQQSSNVIMTVDSMIKAGGLDPQKDVKRKVIGYGIEELTEGLVDVMTGYATNEPLTAQEKGYEVVLIRPSQYGIIDYADVLFTSEEMITRSPDLVKAYVTATLKGWDYVLKHKDEAIDVVMKYVGENSSRLHQENMLEASVPLIKPQGVATLGSMTYLSWKRLYEQMLAAGLLSKPIELSQAFTTVYLPK